jgi:hypothetical protein
MNDFLFKSKRMTRIRRLSIIDNSIIHWMNVYKTQVLYNEDQRFCWDSKSFIWDAQSKNNDYHWESIQ